MERLQIIELELEPNNDVTFDFVVAELENWLRPKGLEKLPLEIGSTATSSGFTNTPFGAQKIEIRARYLRTDNSSGYLVVAEQEIAPDLRFVTDVSLVRNIDGIHLRVGSSRNPNTRLVKPLPFTEVKTPTFLKAILRNGAIFSFANGVHLTSGFSKINDSSEIPNLLKVLSQPERPPVLLIDTVRRERVEFAREIAQSLAGLVQVFCIPWVMGIREFNEMAPEYEIPFAGSRLIWPGTGVWNPRYEASEIGDFAATDIVRKVRAASRIARANDIQWAKLAREFSEEQRERNTSQIASRLRESFGKSDSQLREEIERLEILVQEKDDEIRRKHEEHEEFIRTFDAAPDDSPIPTESLEEKDEEIRKLNARIAWLEQRVDWNFHKNGVAAKSFDETPAEIGDEFFRHLEIVTQESIVFTDSATKSWQRTGYLHEDKMRSALIQLARASMEWRGSDGNLGANPIDWFKTKFELTYAPKDEPLRRSKLGNFEFEGEIYSRIPHIKLGDNSDRANVGRIYFAWDDRNLRVIVDHIGQHLIGDGKG